MHAAFDIGNVLCEVNIAIFTDKLAELYPNIGNPMHFLDGLQASQDLGAVSLEQGLRNWLKIQNEEHISILLKSWNEAVIPNEMMLNFMDNLRSEGVKIALLSNMGSEHAKFLRTSCPRMFYRTKEHLSFEVGARKPTKVYFQSFLLDHPEFTGAVYLDDREENLIAGKKYSFKSFRFNLEELLKSPISKQKIELDKAKSYIFNRKYDVLPQGPKLEYDPPKDFP